MSLNIEISKDNYRVLKIEINGKISYLGSKYNQKREIDKFISNISEFVEKDIIIVLGLSFGEHIKELSKLLLADNKLLIIEFNQELIEYCLNDVKIEKNICKKNISIVKNLEEVRKFFDTNLSELNARNVRIYPYSVYDKIYNQEIKEVYTLIKNTMIQRVISKNTVEISAENSFNNMLSNLKHICKSTEVNILKDKYKNKPAIIVSAGPSLSKNIDKLKGINNAVILSGGRTLGALFEREIMPNCLGIVDPGEVSYKLVEPYIKHVSCPLLYTELSNEKTVREHNGGKYFWPSTNFIEGLWGRKIKSLYGGGSIAHTLTLFAAYMGCNPIIFIGQDLAYTGERGHATCAGNKWDEWTFDKYKKDDDIFIKDINGENIRTSVLLNDYRLALEDIILKYKDDTTFINATEGGANIEGTENRILEEVLKEFNTEAIIPLDNFLSNEDKIEDVINYLEQSLVSIKRRMGLCKKGMKILEEYKRNYLLNNANEVNKNIKELDEIDRITDERKSVVELMMYKMTYEIGSIDEYQVKFNDSQKIILEKNTKKNHAIYSKMLGILENAYPKVEIIINELKESKKQ